MIRKRLMEPIQEKHEKGGSSEEIHPLQTASVLKRLFEYLTVDELKTARLVCEHWKYSATPLLQQKAIVKLDGICPICKSEWKSRKKSIEAHNHYETIPFYRFVTQLQHMYPRDRDQIVFYRNFQIKNLNLYLISRLHTEPTKYFLQFVKLMGSKVFELKLDSIQVCPTESIYQIISMFKHLEMIHFSNVKVWLDPVIINQGDQNRSRSNSINIRTTNNAGKSAQYEENGFLKSITFSNGWNSDELLDWDVIFATCPELQELNLTELSPSEIKNCLSTILNLPQGVLRNTLNIKTLTINPRAKIEDQLLKLPVALAAAKPILCSDETEAKITSVDENDFSQDFKQITDNFRKLNMTHLITAVATKLNSIRHLKLRLPYTDEGNTFPQILEACTDNLVSVSLSRHPTIFVVQNDLVFKPNPFEKSEEHILEFPFVKKLEIAHNFIDNFDEIKQSFPRLSTLHLNIVPTEFVCPVGKITTYHTYLKTTVLLNMKSSAAMENITNLVWNIEEARARLNYKKKAFVDCINGMDQIFSILDQDQEQDGRKSSADNEKRGIRTVVYKSNGVKHISKVFPNLTKLSISITRGIDLHVIFRDLSQLHDLTLLENSFYRVKDEDIIGWKEDDDVDHGRFGENAVHGKSERIPNEGIKQLKQLRRLSMENNNCCLTNQSIKYGFVHLKRLRSLYISRGKKLTLRGLRILNRLRFLVYIKVTKLKQDSPNSSEKADEEVNTDEELIEAYELALSKNPTLDKIPIRELREFPLTRNFDRADKYKRKPKTKIPALISSTNQHQRKYPSPTSYPSKTVMINVSRKGMLPILVSSNQSTSATLDYRKLHLTNDELVLPPIVPSQALDTDHTLLPKDDLTIKEIKEILDMSQDALLRYELEKRSKNRKVDKLFDQITTKKRLKRYGKYELGEKYHRIGGRRYFFIRTTYKVNGRTYELVRRKYENEGEEEKQLLTKKAWQARKRKEELKANKAKARANSGKDGDTLQTQGRRTSSIDDEDGSESEYERSIKDYDEEDEFEEYCDEDDENYLEFKHPPRGYDSEGAEAESSDEEEGKCLEDDTMYEGDKEYYDDSQFEDDGPEADNDNDEISDTGSGSGNESHSDSATESDSEAHSYSGHSDTNLPTPGKSYASDDNYSSGHFSADKDFISDSNSIASLPRPSQTLNSHHTLEQTNSVDENDDNVSLDFQIPKKSGMTMSPMPKLKPSSKKTVVMTRRRIRFAERDLNIDKDILTERQNEEETITINDNNVDKTKTRKKVSFKTKSSKNATTYNNYINNSVKYTSCKKSKAVHKQFSKGGNVENIDIGKNDYRSNMRPQSVTENAIDDKIRAVEKEFKLQFVDSSNSSIDLDDGNHDIQIQTNHSRIIPLSSGEFEGDAIDFFDRASKSNINQLEPERAKNYSLNHLRLSALEMESEESGQHYENYDDQMYSDSHNSNYTPTEVSKQERVNSKRKHCKQENAYVCGLDDSDPMLALGSNFSIDSKSNIVDDVDKFPHSILSSNPNHLEEGDVGDQDEMGAKLETMRKEMMQDIMKSSPISATV